MKNTSIEHQIVNSVSKRISSMKIWDNILNDANFNSKFSDAVSESVIVNLRYRVCDNLNVCESIYDFLHERR